MNTFDLLRRAERVAPAPEEGYFLFGNDLASAVDFWVMVILMSYRDRAREAKFMTEGDVDYLCYIVDDQLYDLLPPPRELREFLVKAIFDIVGVTEQVFQKMSEKGMPTVKAAGNVAAGDLITLLGVEYEISKGLITLSFEVREDLSTIAAQVF